MHARLLFVFFMTVIAALGAVSGCTTQSCVARGKTTSYSGAATYSIHFDAGQVIAGSENTSFNAVDYDANCLYDNEEFVASIDQCSLWIQSNAVATSGSSDDDDDDSNAPALSKTTIESAQSCVITLPEGQATITITQGNLVLGTDFETASFDANVAAWNGTAATGTLHLDFSGN